MIRVNAFLLAAVSLSAAVSLMALDPAGLPSTTAGQVFAEWLESLNSGIAERVQAFETAHRTQNPSIYQSMFLRAKTGGFNVVRVEASEPDSITVLLGEKYTEQLQRVSLAVTADSPAKIVTLVVQLQRPRTWQFRDLAWPRP